MLINSTERNVLIKKKCRCPDILYCTCHVEDKYEVRVADFDYICLSESDDDINKRGGTLMYRPPEVALLFSPPPSCSFFVVFPVAMRHK